VIFGKDIRSEKKESKIAIFVIYLDFHCVAKNIERWLKIYTLFLVYGGMVFSVSPCFYWQVFTKFQPEKYNFNPYKGVFIEKKKTQICQILRK